MTDNEQELFNIIRSHDDPERALLTAIEIITAYLNPRASSESTLSVDYRECS